MFSRSLIPQAQLPSSGDISRRDFCLFSNIMGVNGALNVVLTAPKNTFEKLISNVSLTPLERYTVHVCLTLYCFYK